jgi:hypothetical protein
MFKGRTYLPIGRLALAIVLFVASSGFTMVIHSCLMVERACCDSMMAGGAMQHSAGSPAADARLAKPPSSCCENTVVGGLSRTTATLETQAASHHHKMVLAVAGTDLGDGQPQACSSFIAHRHFRPPDPPPTGLYISNSALLI